jgi:4-amino-4-deoxy-L-arabinose transferase-like glycosyltransferase
MHTHRRTKINSSQLKVLWAGGLLVVFAIYSYARGSYTISLFWAWLLGIALMGYYFFSQRIRERFYDRTDVIVISVLLLLFGFLYLFDIYQVPRQVNTDEITIMHFMRELTMPVHPDPFALSNYFQFPAMIFIIFGKLGIALGGITLAHIRTIHAISGVLIIVSSYAFFRLYASAYYAAGGALIVGFNHALFAISRMAMRDNVATLIEVAGLALLLRGFEKKSTFESYLGGVVAGFGFYNYFPARITIALWAVYLVGVFFFYRKTIDWRWMVRHTAAVSIGFLAVLAPVAIATVGLPDFGQTYAREQILLTSEGRALQQRWDGSTSIEQGLYINMMNSFSVFNGSIHDHGYIYPNYGHGITDPTTGILLWAGLIALLATRYKKPAHLLLILGFAFLFLFFAFLTTKNPNYTRFLLLLPFVGALCMIPFALFEKSRLRMIRVASRTVFACAVVIIVFSNIFIFADFVDAGITNGNDVGDTGRYVEDRREKSGYNFYLLADAAYMYYSWGVEGQWRRWLSFFSDEAHQSTYVVSPAHLSAIEYEKPFTIFFSKEVVDDYGRVFIDQFPSGILRNITPDGRLQAFEVLE